MTSDQFRYDENNKVSFHNHLKNIVFEAVENSNYSLKDEKVLVLKAFILFLLFAASYGLYLLFGGESLALNIILSIPWALIMVSIQMSVMHDASHGATSENARTNWLLLNVISFFGGSPTLWVHQHVRAHHSYTNVPGKDHDIDTHGLLRLCDEQELKKHHKYQHIYAWLLYPLFVLSWIWWGDYRDIKDNTYSIPKKKLKKIVYETILVKISHLVFFILLPFYMIGDPILALTGYLISFGIMGIIMVVIFQLAHVSMTQKFAPEEDLRKSDWALFQLASTANFASNNAVLSWYLGGLNHQIEHHIFPNLSHTHYPRIQHLVKRVCEESGVTYQSFPTLFDAIKNHQNHLKLFGSPSIDKSTV